MIQEEATIRMSDPQQGQQKPLNTRPSDDPRQSASELTSQPGEPAVPGVSTDEVNVPAANAAARAKAAPVVQAERGSVRTIHYSLSYMVRHAGAGPNGAIVLLHDLPGGAFSWADVLPQLEATGRAVYAFDMLGYGQSEHAWPSDTSIWGHADSLSYAFDALGLRDIVLVGIGMGGAVAQVLATRIYREHVAQLVLLDSYAYDYAFAPNWPLPEMVKRQDPEAPRHTSLDQLLSDLRSALPLASAKPKFLAGSKLDAYLNGWNTEMGKEMLFQHIRLMLPLYSNAVSSYLRKLDVPVLLIWGESDAITPRTLGERMLREIPGSRLEIIPNAGHLVLDDAPDAVGKLIGDFAGAYTPGRVVAAR